MASGGVFKLIANDGKADRMIIATALINQRIMDIMCYRKRQGRADPTPTLLDLEKTHILYVNAHFKPFAAIGFEYNKVRPSSGNPVLGGSVQFSIPQYGDFFNDIVLRVRLSQCAFDTYQSPGIDTSHRYVDATGRSVQTTDGSPLTVRNLAAYCEYPGTRLLKKVSFEVNGNPLDTYTVISSVMSDKFSQPINKQIGYQRLLGQETSLRGYSVPFAAPIVDDNINTPPNITRFSSDQSNQQIQPFTSTNSLSPQYMSLPTMPQPAQSLLIGATSAINGMNTTNDFDCGRYGREVYNGPQTPKPIQSPLELWVNLKHWFCKDVRLSIPSVSIPYGQRFISIELESAVNLIYEIPSIYRVPILQYLWPTTYIYQYDIVNMGSNTMSQYPLTIQACELYINNIFLNPEIHDIYIRRIGFSLIRVYREQTSRVNNNSDLLLSQLKWPIEYMYVGLRPVWNITNYSLIASNISPPSIINTSGNLLTPYAWNKLTDIVTANIPLSSSISNIIVQDTNDPPNYMSGNNISYSTTPNDYYYIPVPTVDTMSLVSHGITIYDSFQDLFYNAYTPLKYGDIMVNTPSDPGALMINTALFPGTYQPSGHLNISRARETYLQWSSSYITTKTPADVLISATAINFLLVSDGSAILRYST